MSLYKGRYRIESARMAGWDYAAAGCYAVTICTRERGSYLGDVVKGEMHLSTMGEIVAEEWQRSAEVRPYVVLDEWVIMPNHLHGIIAIGEKAGDAAMPRPDDDAETPRDIGTVETPRDIGTVETPRRGVSTPQAPAPPRLQAGSLGAIIGQFKSLCTKRIWAAKLGDFGWQTRFYDQIIRNEESLQRIRQYIHDNPLNWLVDKYYPTR